MKITKEKAELNKELLSRISEAQAAVNTQIERKENLANQRVDVEAQIGVLQNELHTIEIKQKYTEKDLQDATRQLNYMKEKFWEENLV